MFASSGGADRPDDGIGPRLGIWNKQVYDGMVWYGIDLPTIVWYCMVWHCMAWYSIVMVLHGMV